jgi:nucleoside-diphosphate-sugar epimerase
MRAIVTGGAGFIGSHLIEELVRRGDEVTCIERPGSPTEWIRGLPVRVRDIGLDNVRALEQELAGADTVFHLAALTQALRRAEYYAVNTEGTAMLLQAAARQGGGAPRFVFMSSIAAAGPCRNGEMLTPDTIPFPLSHYGHSKLLAEAVVHAYRDRVPSVILRFPTVYGPRERAVLKLFQLVRRRVALNVGGWDRANSVIYVRDVVAALLAAATSPQAVGRTYCVTHPVAVTWREFADAVGRALGRRPLLLTVPSGVARMVAVSAEAAAAVTRRAAILNRDRVREMTQSRWVCDGARAQRELAFQAGWGIDRGVPETAAWYKEAQWI